MRKLSLFSGIGGIDLAAHWVGIETVAFCEREPFPQKVLRRHWPNVTIYDDVCTLTAERLEEDGIIGSGRTIDIISAGYPCQPFSNAGNRKGKEDDRHLWPEVARLLREIRPRWFLGENVAGHITLGLDDVLAELESIGYTAQAFVIPSAAVGAPHRRDRVFIVGYTECSGCSREPRGRAEQESADRHSELEEGIMGNSASQGFQEWRQSRLPSTRAETRTGMESEFERSSQDVAHAQSESSRRLSVRKRSEDAGSSCSCKDVADTKSKRSREAREYQCGESEEWPAGGGKDVANPSCTGQQECHPTAVTDRSRYGSRSVNARRSNRTIESDMGGVLDGLSSRLDEHRWPAGLGQPQYVWEPPRVATGVKDRVGRLKALGNAVNPVQIYPVLAAIKAINDKLSRMEAYPCLGPEQEGTSW